MTKHTDGIKGLYGCRVCVEIALAQGKDTWPLYPRDQVIFRGPEVYCLKHAAPGQDLNDVAP